MKETTPDLTRISKYMSLILRHKPQVIGIQLDAHGWADVNALLAGISKKYPINRDILEEIVQSDEKQAASIEAQGLLPQNRLYVHLSPDPETAEKVGRRHGEPVIYLVAAGQMYRDGYRFYLSANGVWLTKVVPAPYLKRLEE